MEQEEKIKILKNLLAFGRGVLTAAICLVIKLICNFSALSSYVGGEGFFADTPPYFVHIVCFLTSLIIYYFVTRAMSNYNGRLMDEYLCEGERNLGFFKNLKSLFGNSEFMIEALVATFIMFIGGAVGASYEIAGMFHFADGFSKNSTGFIPGFVTAALTFLFYSISKADAYGFWDSLKKEDEREKVRRRVSLILKLAILFVLCPIIATVMPLLPLALVTLGALIYAIILAVSLPLFIGSVVLIALLVWLTFFLTKVLFRRRFISGILNTVRDIDAKITVMRNPYLSLITRRRIFSFDIELEGRLYCCVNISSKHRWTPICFTEDGRGYHKHVIGTKRHNITVKDFFEFDTPSGGVPILIVTPTPKEVFISDEYGEKRLFNADRLWRWTAYDKEAFLGALGRKILGVFDRESEDKNSDSGISVPTKFIQ